MPARTMALLRQLALLCLRAVCCNTGCFGKFSPRSCVLPITLIFIIVLVMQLGRPVLAERKIAQLFTKMLSRRLWISERQPLTVLLY